VFPIHAFPFHDPDSRFTHHASRITSPISAFQLLQSTINSRTINRLRPLNPRLSTLNHPRSVVPSSQRPVALWTLNHQLQNYQPPPAFDLLITEPKRPKLWVDPFSASLSPYVPCAWSVVSSPWSRSPILAFQRFSLSACQLFSISNGPVVLWPPVKVQGSRFKVRCSSVRSRSPVDSQPSTLNHRPLTGSVPYTRFHVSRSRFTFHASRITHHVSLSVSFAVNAPAFGSRISDFLRISVFGLRIYRLLPPSFTP
jgi:hypothetical protein